MCVRFRDFFAAVGRGRGRVWSEFLWGAVFREGCDGFWMGFEYSVVELS